MVPLRHFSKKKKITKNILSCCEKLGRSKNNNNNNNDNNNNTKATNMDMSKERKT